MFQCVVTPLYQDNFKRTVYSKQKNTASIKIALISRLAPEFQVEVIRSL